MTFNQVFPNWLLVVILTFLLVLLSIKTLRSGLRLYAAERRGAEENEEAFPLTGYFIFACGPFHIVLPGLAVFLSGR